MGIVFLLAAILMCYGNTIYSPHTVLRVLLGEDIKGAAFTIKTLRLPRMLAALLSGIAFGLAGNTFQRLLGNPLASPDIIGITSGASVAAVFGILILNLSETQVSFLAVLSGLFVSALIYFLSQGSSFSNSKLILTGIGVQAFLNAAISWMLLKASEYDVPNALRWLNGSLNGTKMDQIPELFLVVCLATLALLLFDSHLQILQLGDAFATTLGLKLRTSRLLFILCALLLIAFSTSVTGPITSIAFLSGPIASKLSGDSSRNMMSAGLVGAILVMASDIIGQFAFQTHYPVGVITGILGAPYLIFLLLRINRKGEHLS